MIITIFILSWLWSLNVKKIQVEMIDETLKKYEYKKEYNLFLVYKKDKFFSRYKCAKNNINLIILPPCKG